LRDTIFQAELERVRQQRIPTRFEIQAPFTHQWFEIHAYPTAEGIAGYVRDVTARKRADVASRFLSDASAILASTLEVEATLESIMRLVMQNLADGCAIRLLDDQGAVVRTTIHSRDETKASLLREMEQRYPSQIGSVDGAERAMRTGRSTLVRRVTDRALVDVAVDATHLEMLRGLDLHSLMYVPFVAHGRPLGVITLASHTASRRFDEADLSLAEELAHRAALALDNARLYDAAYRERRAAEEALERMQRDQT
jgi:GAF domain-containing protein